VRQDLILTKLKAQKSVGLKYETDARCSLTLGCEHPSAQFKAQS